MDHQCIMESSLDEFIAEYFGSTYRAKYYGGNPTDESNNNHSPSSDTPFSNSSSSSTIVSNFNLGEDELMNSMSMSMSSLEISTNDEDLNDTDMTNNNEFLTPTSNKIINIKARRRSLSYDIIFNPLDTQSHHSHGGIQIRIKNSRHDHNDFNWNSPHKEKKTRPLAIKGSSTSLKAKKELKDKKQSKSLQLENKQLRLKNAQLYREIRELRDKLGNAEKTISKLEIEVATFYC